MNPAIAYFNPRIGINEHPGRCGSLHTDIPSNFLLLDDIFIKKPLLPVVRGLGGSDRELFSRFCTARCYVERLRSPREPLSQKMAVSIASNQ